MADTQRLMSDFLATLVEMTRSAHIICLGRAPHESWRTFLIGLAPVSGVRLVFGEISAQKKTDVWASPNRWNYEVSGDLMPCPSDVRPEWPIPVSVFNLERESVNQQESSSPRVQQVRLSVPDPTNPALDLCAYFTFDNGIWAVENRCTNLIMVDGDYSKPIPKGTLLSSFIEADIARCSLGNSTTTLQPTAISSLLDADTFRNLDQQQIWALRTLSPKVQAHIILDGTALKFKASDYNVQAREHYLESYHGNEQYILGDVTRFWPSHRLWYCSSTGTDRTEEFAVAKQIQASFRLHRAPYQDVQYWLSRHSMHPLEAGDVETERSILAYYTIPSGELVAVTHAYHEHDETPGTSSRCLPEISDSLALLKTCLTGLFSAGFPYESNDWANLTITSISFTRNQELAIRFDPTYQGVMEIDEIMKIFNFFSRAIRRPREPIIERFLCTPFHTVAQALAHSPRREYHIFSLDWTESFTMRTAYAGRSGSRASCVQASDVVRYLRFRHPASKRAIQQLVRDHARLGSRGRSREPEFTHIMFADVFAMARRERWAEPKLLSTQFHTMQLPVLQSPAEGSYFECSRLRARADDQKLAAFDRRYSGYPFVDVHSTTAPQAYAGSYAAVRDLNDMCACLGLAPPDNVAWQLASMPPAVSGDQRPMVVFWDPADFNSPVLTAEGWYRYHDSSYTLEQLRALLERCGKSTDWTRHTQPYPLIFDHRE